MHAHSQYNYVVVLVQHLRASWLRPGRTLHLKTEAQSGGHESLTLKTSSMQLSVTGAILEGTFDGWVWCPVEVCTLFAPTDNP